METTLKIEIEGEEWVLTIKRNTQKVLQTKQHKVLCYDAVVSKLLE